MRTNKLFAATWHSRVNRDQIRDGANILGDVVPIGGAAL